PGIGPTAGHIGDSNRAHITRQKPQILFRTVTLKLEGTAINCPWLKLTNSFNHVKFRRLLPVAVAFNRCNPKPRWAALALNTTVIVRFVRRREEIIAGQTLNMETAALIAFPDIVNI